MRSMLYRFLATFLAASVLIGLWACPARAQVLPRVPRAADAGLMVDTSSAATGGVLITDMAGNSPLVNSGLQRADRVLSVNGQPVRSDSQLVQPLIYGSTPNEQVNVSIMRNGVRQTLLMQRGWPDASNGDDRLYWHTRIIYDADRSPLVVRRLQQGGADLLRSGYTPVTVTRLDQLR
jgi:predicted metalloprotease with PDZ domain